MLTKKIKVKSATTPGHEMQLHSYLAELMLLRQYGKGSLCPYFWRNKFWKGKYIREVKAISKFLKSHGQNAVVNIACRPEIITFTNYAELEFFLQKESAAVARIAKPKDTSETINETAEVTEDLRESRYFIRKKGLFKKLDEFEKYI